MDRMMEGTKDLLIDLLTTNFLFQLGLGIWLSSHVLRFLLRYFKVGQPGPVWAGVFDISHSVAILSLKCEEWYGHISSTYGPIARIGPHTLLTSSPEIWMHVNNVRTPYKRSLWFYRATRIEPGINHVVAETDTEKHDKRRKQLAAGYSGKDNPNLEASIDARLRDFIYFVLRKYAASGKEDAVSMDLGQKVPYLTLDVISHLALGEAFGMSKADKDLHGYCASGEAGLWISNLTMGLGINWLIHLPYLSSFLLPSAKEPQGFGHMIGAAHRIVNKRLEKMQPGVDDLSGKSDMLASFVNHGLTSHKDLRSELLEVILAGSDTTASAIRCIMLGLLQHPASYRKLQAEIDEACRTGAAPKSPGIISDAEAKKLPYLDACIREGMRIFPPVADFFSRDAPSGGDRVPYIDDDGKEQSVFIPGGTYIGYSAWGMHHSRHTYAPDPKTYRPERWLDTSDPEKLERMLKTNELIFGYGKWQCLGKAVAWIEIRKTIFECLRGFEWELVNTKTPWKTKNLVGLFAIKDFWVRVREREVKSRGAFSERRLKTR